MTNPRRIHSKLSENIHERARRKEKMMTNLRKPLVTLALASSALGLSFGVGLNPADAATHAGTTTTTFSSSSPSASAVSSRLAVASLSHNTSHVQDDWTVEWQMPLGPRGR